MSAVRGTALVTAVAVALFAGLYFLPRAPAVTHTDFLVLGPGSVEFCDAANPKFLAVVGRTAPATLAVRSGSGAVGQPSGIQLSLRTATDKPIGPKDLLPTDGAAVRLFVVGAAREDFHRAAALPGDKPGDWAFAFTPAAAGRYRVFADFTPRATGKELYASADFVVRGAAGAPAAAPRLSEAQPWSAEAGGHKLHLSAEPLPLAARQAFSAELTVDGKPAPAGTSLVLFDPDATGLVNLRDSADHPAHFAVTIPDSGPYVAWAVVPLGGRDLYAPFAFSVAP